MGLNSEFVSKVIFPKLLILLANSTGSLGFVTVCGRLLFPVPPTSVATTAVW